MQLQALTAALLLGLAAAATETVTPTTTVTAPATTVSQTAATGMASIVADIPGCALKCLQDAATQVGCTGVADFDCLCSGSHAAELITKATLCIGIGNNCDIAKTGLASGLLCNALNNDPSQADLASASAVVNSELATATRNAAARPTDVAAAGAFGVMAAIAAFAL